MAQSGKGLISVFQEFFASIAKAGWGVGEGGGLGTGLFLRP